MTWGVRREGISFVSRGSSKSGSQGRETYETWRGGDRYGVLECHVHFLLVFTSKSTNSLNGFLCRLITVSVLLPGLEDLGSSRVLNGVVKRREDGTDHTVNSRPL